MQNDSAKNPLRILATEALTAKHRQKRMNKDVDALASRDRGPWDSEHRRQHDALMKKQRIAQIGRGVCIAAAFILWGAVGALAAIQF